MQPKYCLFDLDGTLIDSSEGIVHSIAYAFDKMGLSPLLPHEAAGFIGPPLARSFAKYRGLSDEDALLAVRYYRENYNAGGVLECRLYDGVRELLASLNERGVVCALATCKPHIYADRILSHLGLSQYVSFVSGAELSGVRGEKHEVVAYALEQMNISDPSSALMIGDRADDVRGARENGVLCLGALWGFGTKEELLDAGAIGVFDSPYEMQKYLKST